MPHQPTLPEPSGKSLPSPLFAARPGWGGRLKKWFSHNIYSAIFRGILLGAALLIIGSLMRAPEPQISLEPTPTPSNSSTETAAQGEGISQLTARALDGWLAAQVPAVLLDGVQHLYAVDRITRLAVSIGSRPGGLIYTGETVQFPHSLFKTVTTEALELSAAQYRAWMRVVR